MAKESKTSIDNTPMTKEEEFEIYRLLKDKVSIEEVQQKVRRHDGSEWSKSKLTKLRAKINKGYIPSVDGEYAYNNLMGVDLGEDLKDFDAEKSMSRSFKMATRLLEKALEDAEQGYEIEDEMRRKVPIKTIIECVEKAGRYWTNYQKTKKESGKSGTMTIDYKEMAKLYTTFNKETGEFEYDAAGHMKEVLNTAYKDEDQYDSPDSNS